MTQKPLFVVGTARSGSTLLAKMLSAHPQVMVASDPFFPLFRSLRNAIWRAAFPKRSVDLAQPLQDFYFTDDRIRQFDALLQADLSLPFEASEWDGLHKATLSRIQQECADLAPFLADIRGGSYRELFARGLGIIARGRNAEARTWVGMKEVWVVDFIPALARTFPEASFIVLLRDPRATVASMLGFRETDPTQLAHPLSYWRHWRKQSACVHHFKNDAGLKNRVFSLRYEDLVQRPAEQAGAICRFLGIPFDSKMTETAYSNSSFGPLKGISTASRERWREKLAPEAVQTADLVCGAEMKLSGYELSGAPLHEDAVLEYLKQSADEPSSWRSDLGDPALDYAMELSRRNLLEADYAPSADEIRRGFLFEDIFAAMRSKKKPQTVPR